MAAIPLAAEYAAGLEASMSGVPGAANAAAVGADIPPATPWVKKLGVNPLNIQTGIGLLRDVGSGVSNAINQEQGDTATTVEAPAETAPYSIQALQDVAGSTGTANEALGKAGDLTQQIVTPVAKRAVESSQGLQKTAQDFATKAYNEHLSATDDAINKSKELKVAIDNAAAASTINPNAYWDSLAGPDKDNPQYGKKIMVAIGMVLSGIGSGLTGQPNMALEMYKRNTDLAIDAQKRKFENLMRVAAERRGLLKTAQDRQTIATTAANAATYAVAQFNDAAIKSAMAQTQGAGAPYQAEQLKNINNRYFLNAADSHNSYMLRTLQSGDKRQANLLGLGIGAITDSIAGTKLGMDKESPAMRALERNKNQYFGETPTGPQGGTTAVFKAPENMSVDEGLKNKDFLSKYSDKLGEK